MERFTKSKTMVFPREIIVGHKTNRQIAELCDRIISGKNGLVVVDKNTKKLSGDQISKILKKSNYNVNEIIVTGPTVGEVNKVINYAKKKNIDFLLGVGGGNIIDVTKLASFDISKPFIL